MKIDLIDTLNSIGDHVDTFFCLITRMVHTLVRMVHTLVGVCQYGIYGKKSVNCVPTFSKVSQSGPFQKKKLTSLTARHMSLSHFFYLFIFF